MTLLAQWASMQEDLFTRAVSTDYHALVINFGLRVDEVHRTDPRRREQNFTPRGPSGLCGRFSII